MGYKILIVDDSPLIRRLIGSCIEEKTDWQVCGEAENGQIAIQKVRELHPDVVLLDFHMPVMNGFEASRCIKREFPGTQILMVSQFESGLFAQEAIAAGASEFVAKINLSYELVPALRRVLSLNPARRDAQAS
jgi:DNA-binding NarL/FixJ family response regulator